MKFYKAALNTVAGDNEKIIYIIPSENEEANEQGNPAYDEDILLSSAEYKAYVRSTKANVVDVTYTLFEADKINLNYDDILAADKSGSLTEIMSGSYVIEVKKAKPKKSGGGKNSSGMYIVIGIIVVAVVALFIFGSSFKENKKTANEEMTAPETEKTTISETAEISEAPVITEEITFSETTTTASTTRFEPPMKIIAKFNKNGGVGALDTKEYEIGTVATLPYTEISKAGYTLVGWSENASGETIYNNSDNFFVVPENDITLYAIWTPAEYAVTYHYQIGDKAATTVEYAKFGEPVKLMELSAHSSSGEFAGWALTPNSDTPLKSCTMPDGGLELYAVYGNKAETTETTAADTAQ